MRNIVCCQVKLKGLPSKAAMFFVKDIDGEVIENLRKRVLVRNNFECQARGCTRHKIVTNCEHKKTRTRTSLDVADNDLQEMTAIKVSKM